MKLNEFKILKPDDPKFKECDHKWYPCAEEVGECINPNGEYVEGYGHTRVCIMRQVDEICRICNVKKSYLEGQL